MLCYVDELERWLDKTGINKDDLCLVGSSALAARGLRENHDLEFIVKPDVRKKLKLKYDFFWLTFHVDMDAHIELWKNQLFRIGITDGRIFKEKLYDVIDGYNVVFIDIEKLYKLELGREKDNVDLERIYNYKHAIKYRRKRTDRLYRAFFYVMEKIEFISYSLWLKMKRIWINGGVEMDSNVHIILWP